MDDTVPQAQPPAADVPSQPSTPARRVRLSATAWIALGITAIVVLATAVVLLAGNEAQARYPADSPEAALQGYLTSWYDRAYSDAYGYFSTNVTSMMAEADFRQQAGYSYGTTNQTVTLERVSGTGNSRSLYLSVQENYGPDFGGGAYTHDVQVNMVLEPGGWKIDDPLIGLEPYYGYSY
jgi:hypothetical protein